MIAGRHSVLLVLLLLAALVIMGFVYGAIRTQRVEAELLRLPADAVSSHEALVAFAMERGPYLFVDHCAACHGTDMRGDAHRGTPDLQDAVWLFGHGRISDIERTIRYGVRSGHPKARHDDEPMGKKRRGGCPSWINELDPAAIRTLAVYVHQVSRESGCGHHAC
jgi:cbb3-type cytochrome c oxidase subunit III